jgi:hypothetical protein
MSATILFFGTYSLLLNTHRLILERSGFRALSAGCLCDFHIVTENQHIDLCLLCSSLDSEDRDQAISILSTLHPDVPYMILSPGVSLAGRKAAPPIVNSLAGPEFLLNSVRESLAVNVQA